MTRVTRRYRFSASHRLHSAQLSGEENQTLYGKCNNPYGHGHDYVLEVSVSGPVDSRTGLLVPIESLDRLVASEILRPLASKNLNLDVPEFVQTVPTTENLAIDIRTRLDRAWKAAFPDGGPALSRVRVQETDRNIFELGV